jgi:hypothetical protein
MSITGGRTALYRFYDRREALLYVGISNDPRRRQSEHKTKPWYPQVRHQAVTWYDTEREARAAEDRAIRKECPEFNVAGAVRPARARFAIHPTRWALIGTAFYVISMVMTFAVIYVPQFRAVLVPCTFAMYLLAPATMLAAMALIAAPLIKRFAAWVERNSTYPVGTCVLIKRGGVPVSPS